MPRPIPAPQQAQSVNQVENHQPATRSLARQPAVQALSLAALLLGSASLLLPATAAAAAGDRAAAFDAERRWFAGISGATSQSSFNVGSGAGGNTRSLTDTGMLRVGRYGQPTRYGVDLMYVRYSEATLWLATGWLDYVIPWGDIFSGYAGITAGGVSLRWRGNNPFGAGTDFGVDGNQEISWAAGLRAGGLIEVTELVQVEVGYRFLFTGLEDRFSNDDVDAKVELRNQRVVHAGVNFRF